MVVSVLGRPDTRRLDVVRAAIRQTAQECQGGEQQDAPEHNCDPLAARLLARGLGTVTNLVFVPAPTWTGGISSHFLDSHLERESTHSGGAKTTGKVEAGRASALWKCKHWT